MTDTPEKLRTYAELATARRIAESIDTVIHRIDSCFNRLSGSVIVKLDAPVVWSMYGGWTTDLSVAEVVPVPPVSSKGLQATVSNGSAKIPSSAMI